MLDSLPSAYSPIVLLDEVGQIFERIIADRIVGCLGNAGPDLSNVQFGFRKGRSTVEIQRVKTFGTGGRSGRSGAGRVVGYRQRFQHLALCMYQRGATSS